MAKLIEHYELTERIKQLNGATWWRGWDSKLERDVSIWTLPVGDSRILKLKASAAAAANLHDPRALRVLDVVANDELFAVVSEWVHGISVAERVLGRAPLRDVLEITNSLIECISSAHSQGVYHGALTADDVVLAQSGIKIRGFGIAEVIVEPFGGSAQSADLAAIAAVSYAALTARWPLLSACSLPPAPSQNGLVALPSQLTPKLPAFWDNFMQQTLPTINPNPTVDLAELSGLLNVQSKSKLNLPAIELPPSSISKTGLLGSLVTIAVLLIAGSALFFTSLVNPAGIQAGDDQLTGTDLRSEALPIAELLIIGNAKPLTLNSPITINNQTGIQIKLAERRTVQRIELDLSISGVDLIAQITDQPLTEISDIGVLGEIKDGSSSAIIFGPRFVTGQYVTIWFTLPSNSAVISRLAVYGTPS